MASTTLIGDLLTLVHDSRHSYQVSLILRYARLERMSFYHILCYGERISYLIGTTIALRELEASLTGIHGSVRTSTLGVSQSLSLSLHGGHGHSVSSGLGVVGLEWVSFYHILSDRHFRSYLTLTTVVSRELQGSTASVRTKSMDIGKGLSLGVNGGLGLVIGILLRYS